MAAPTRTPPGHPDPHLVTRAAARKTADDRQPPPQQQQQQADLPIPWRAADDDLIDDILRRVLELAPQLSASIAAQVARDARSYWGGERIYIGQRSGQDRMLQTQRNAAIRRDHQAGERIPLLERRYGLSRSRIIQILRGAN